MFSTTGYCINSAMHYSAISVETLPENDMVFAFYFSND